MNYERMEALAEGVFEDIRKLRATKGREYSTDKDTLADFKEVAAEAGVSPLQVWLTYERKHSRAIGNYIRSGKVLSETIESRVVDVITYHLLLLGLIEDAAAEAEGGIQTGNRRLRAEADKDGPTELPRERRLTEPTAT